MPYKVVYLSTFLKTRHSVYNTRRSPANGLVLEVPHFASLVYNLTKHVGLSFAHDTAKIWNDPPDDVK